MTIWNTSAEEPFAWSWVTASFRCWTSPIEPVVALPLPAIALMRSNHTAVGWFAMALPPPVVAAARHCGLLYTVAPTYGLSTLPGGWLFGAVRFTVIDAPV